MSSNINGAGDTPPDPPPFVLPDSLNYKTYTVGSDGKRVYTTPDAYTGGNTLLDLQKLFAPTQNQLSEAAAAALANLVANPSNLSYVASYQAANSALMNVFGAQTQVLKQIFDKIEAMNRNL